MASDVVSRVEPGPARSCGSYRVGHGMHFIQARLSREDGPGRRRAIDAVADDGTITFADGTTLWNHDPERLRVILGRYGAEVLVGSHGVLRVPNGDGAYCFSVTDEPDPCRPETGGTRANESFLDELLRRGGVVRSLPSVLAEGGGQDLITE